MIVWWQPDQVNTKESILPFCDIPSLSHEKRESTERGGYCKLFEKYHFLVIKHNNNL